MSKTTTVQELILKVDEIIKKVEPEYHLLLDVRAQLQGYLEAGGTEVAPVPVEKRGPTPEPVTLKEHILEALAQAMRALTLQEIIAWIRSKGWVSDARDPNSMVASTLHKLAGQKLIKRTGRKMQYRYALR